MNDRTSIALFVHHGLGDVLMAVPLLRACDAAVGGEGELIVIVKGAVESQVVQLSGLSAGVTTWPIGGRGSRPIVDAIRLVGRLRRARLRALLAPHATDGAAMVGIARASGATVSVGPAGRWSQLGFDHTVTVQRGMHKVDYYLSYAAAAGLSTPAAPDVRLHLPEMHRDRAQARLETVENHRWVAFAPGSGELEAHKRWPVASFASLAAALLRDDTIAIAVMGIEAERPLLKAVESMVGSPRCTVVVENDVADALAVVERMSCVVTACAGAGHMAAAVGVPVVGLYGPTNPGFTGPYGGKNRFVRLGLACSPCYGKDFVTGCGTPVCMSGIEAEVVATEVRSVLAGDGPSERPWLETSLLRRPAPPMQRA